MRRLALISLALAMLAAPSGAAAAAPLPASVKVVDCGQTGVFQAKADALPTSERIWVRFTLLQRIGDGRFKPVAAPGLDVWRRSRADAARFLYTQQVANLRDGAEYRVSVQFRWVAANGTTVRTAHRRSGVCGPGGALPNLRIGAIDVIPGQSGSALYRIAVRNTGAHRARDFAVALSVDGAALPTVVVPVLGPLELTFVEIAGPACGTSVTAVVDPEAIVRESNEDDNLRTVACRPR